MSTKPVEKLNSLNTRKERLFRRVQTTFDMIKTLPTKQDIFISRAHDIGEQFKEFDKVLNEITLLNESVGKEDKIDVEDTSTAFEDLFYAIRVTLDKIQASNSVPDSKPSPINDSVLPKLPDIQIPRFSGSYEQFPAFISLYDTLIHKGSYSDIVKFSYLKSLLLHPASQTLSSIELKSENYKEAYDKLVRRYSNKRIVASYHLNKIIHFKPFLSDTAINFRAFLDTYEDNFNSLKALSIDDLADFIMLHMSLNVVDKNTRRLFENRLKEDEVPTFIDFSNFIRAQFRVAEMCNDPNGRPSGSRHPKSPDLTKSTSQLRSKALLSKPNISSPTGGKPKGIGDCPLCKRGHNLLSCPEFSEADVDSRFSILKRFKLCFSCTGPHHLSQCKSTGSCQVCGSHKHHTKLHRVESASIQHKSLDTERPTPPPTQEIHRAISCHTSVGSHALLGTAKGCIRSGYGNWVQCRIVVDPGSQINFITSSLANKLNLKRKNSPLSVSGVGETSIPVSNSEVKCVIAPTSSFPTFEISARVVTNIVGNLPAHPVPPTIYQRFSSLELSDPDFYNSSHVDLLLGIQMYGEILSDPPMFIKGRPCAIHTSFGWIIFGEIPCEATDLSVSSLLVIDCLQNDLKRFWESEEVSIAIPPNPEEAFCEEHFRKTINRDCSGRYIVSLPFRTDSSLTLSSTRHQALQRFRKLEARFARNPEFKLAYAAQINEYIQLDHARVATNPSDYIMTHHGVQRESSTTNLRIVFNGSEKSPDGCSLNDLLLTGPQLQTDIGQLIDNFRTYPIALTCDIKMMFRCIRLNDQDRKFVRFLWRSDPSDPILEFELTTLPFGLKCSPFDAQRVIVQLYHDEAHRFPLAKKCLEESYVDNVVTGAETVQEAFKLYEQLVNLYRAGGFTLRKFSSNAPDLLSEIPQDLLEQPLLDLDDPTSSLSIKVLGLKWNPKQDVLCYSINLGEPMYTKRGVLSIIARIFDINGYLSPVTFWAKYLIQRLWLLQVEWDEDLPECVKGPWSIYLRELPHLEEVHLPRYVLDKDLYSTHLLAFADASERGYGCAVYLRMETNSGEVKIHLIKARSKVAPLKTLTINRLELNAALLMAKVISSLSNLRLKLKTPSIYCFSDSKDVLFWLQTPPHQLKIYIANRVVQILEVTEPSWWHYIPSGMNPADCVSRGLLPNQLLNHTLYWKGPEFLYSSPSEWPISRTEPPDKPLELKPNVLLVNEEPNHLLEYLSKFSSLMKLERVFAFCLRFIKYCRDGKHRTGGSLKPVTKTPLTIKELAESLTCYIRLSQHEHFSQVFYSLQENKPLKGALAKLSPFITKEGTLRVGGRLKNAPIAYNAKHPLLIHQDSHLAKVICDHYHMNSLHGGPQLVQALIHRYYWIPSLRNLVRKRIFRCVTCFKSRAKPTPPYMGDLPDFRISSARAFQRVGVDYGGPYCLKTSSRRNAPRIKCWMALFICPCTHAIHLEAVTDLTTSTFIATLDRFIARRGLPSHIHSDCGTNFVGAARKFKDLFRFLKDSEGEISRHLSEQGIQWHFNPPASPHTGGLWESAIKSAKRHLSAVLQGHIFTYEEFSTLLTRVEAVLNSRPLCAISNHPSDNLDYLSPGHFLIGQPLLARPEEDSNVVFTLNSRWEMLSRSLQHFWKRWHHEYLHTLTPRSKWYMQQENLKEGQLVVLHEKDTPLQEWILARVVKTLPGPDGIVRFVLLKTSSSTLTRPVHKIVPLPPGDTY